MSKSNRAYRRQLNKYQHQFIEENVPHDTANTAKRRRNDDTPDGTVPTGSVYHAHTSVDITQRDRHSTRTSYFRAPQKVPALHVELPSTMPVINSSASEVFNFDIDDDAYVNYLADTNTDTEPIKARRKRTARVFFVDFLLYLRVAHYAPG